MLWIKGHLSNPHGFPIKSAVYQYDSFYWSGGARERLPTGQEYPAREQGLAGPVCPLSVCDGDTT